VSEAGTDKAILYVITAARSRPVVGAGSPEQNGPLLQQPGFARGFCRTLSGPPGSMTQASIRGMYLQHLEAFVADNGCYVMRMKVRERAAGRVAAGPGPEAVRGSDARVCRRARAVSEW
jgi:hypothetical protein